MVDWQAFGKQVMELPLIQPNEDEELTYWYEGTRLVKVFPESTMNDMKTFEVREDDLYLITYPKAGTTWMQEIISMVMHDGNGEEVNKTHVFFRFPFLEMTWAPHYSQVDLIPPTYELINKMDSPRMIKSHLPADLLPPQIHDKKPKVVYVARNPKDCAVSFYHFHNLHLTLQSYKTWDDFFQEFYDGTVYNGSWFDHNLFWWNKRHEPNVLFMKYEDMKRDLKGAVKQTADFLGKPLTDDIVDVIVDHCTFANMKKNPSTNPDTLGFIKDNNQEKKKETTQPSFMRKGKVGDWKNYFSVAQNDTFDQLFNKRMAGKVGDWKNYFSVAQNDTFDQLFNKRMAGTGLKFDFEL